MHPLMVHLLALLVLQTGGTVAANQTVQWCHTPAAFTSSVAGTVSNGTLSYLWESSTDSSNRSAAAGYK